MHLRQGDGGTASWLERRHTVFGRVLGVLLLMIATAGSVAADAYGEDALLSVLALLPLVLLASALFDRTVVRAATGTTRLDWDGEALHVHRSGHTREVAEHEQLAWRAGHDAVELAQGDLVFTSDAGELRLVGPSSPVDREALVQALQQPVEAAASPDWVGAVDHQILSVTGVVGKRQEAPNRPWSEDVAKASLVALFAQFGAVLLLGMSAADVGTLGFALGMLTIAGLCGLGAGAIGVAATRSPEPVLEGARIAVRVDASHLSLTPAGGEAIRWLWDDIDAIEGHTDWIAIVVGDERTLFDLGATDDGVVAGLLRDLRARWQTARTPADARARVEQAAASLRQRQMP